MLDSPPEPVLGSTKLDQVRPAAAAGPSLPSLPSWEQFSSGAAGFFDSAGQAAQGAIQQAGAGIGSAIPKLPSWEEFNKGSNKVASGLAGTVGTGGFGGPTEYRGGGYGEYAAQEAQALGLDPDLIRRLVGQESGGSAGAVSGAGARGVMQLMPATQQALEAKYGISGNTPEGNVQLGVRYFKELLDQYGNVQDALIAYNGGGGAVKAWHDGTPYAESQQYVAAIGASGSGRSSATSAGSPPAGRGGAAASGSLTPDQFGGELSDEEALAACGPAAYVAFARKAGRNPTLREATDLAKTYGWNTGAGMSGPQQQAKMLNEQGIGAEYTPTADPTRIDADLAQGRPVQISTAGHYFVITGKNADGSYQVGKSGTAYKGGSENLTLDQMVKLSGAINGAVHFTGDVGEVPGGTAGSTNYSATDPKLDALLQASSARSAAYNQRPDPEQQPTVDPFTQAARGAAEAAGGLSRGLGDALNPSALAERATSASRGLASGLKSVGDELTQPLRFATPEEQADLEARGNPATIYDASARGSRAMRRGQTGYYEGGKPEDFAEGSFTDELVNAIKRSTLGIGKTAGQYLQKEGERTGDFATGQAGRNLEETFAHFIAQHPEWQTPASRRLDKNPITNPNEWARYIGEGVPSILSALALGLATGPVGSALFTYSQGAGQTYGEAKATGDANAVPKSELVGSVQAVIENLPFFKPIIARSPNVVRRIAESIVGELAETTLQEGSEEVVQEVVANAVAMTYDKQRGLFDNALDAFLGGAAGGAAFGAPRAAGRTAGAAGRVVGEGLAERSLQAQPGVMPRGEGGRVTSDAFRLDYPDGPPPNPVGAEGTERFHHGASQGYDSPDPGRFNSDGLFGPAYYLTSDPRVAADYARERSIGLPSDSPTRYAQQTEQQIATLREMISEEHDPSRRSEYANELARAEAYAEKLRPQVADETLPAETMRLVDVPKSLRLLDADNPTAQDLSAITAQLRLEPPGTIPESLDPSRFVGRRGGFYDELRTTLRWSSSDLNAFLSDAGFDGIRYSGGKRIPMRAANGKPIEHQALAIFPEALPKLRNALSGRQKGGVEGVRHERDKAQMVEANRAEIARQQAAGEEVDTRLSPTDPLRDVSTPGRVVAMPDQGGMFGADETPSPAAGPRFEAVGSGRAGYKVWRIEPDGQRSQASPTFKTQDEAQAMADRLRHLATYKDTGDKPLKVGRDATEDDLLGGDQTPSRPERGLFDQAEEQPQATATAAPPAAPPSPRTAAQAQAQPSPEAEQQPYKQELAGRIAALDAEQAPDDEYARLIASATRTPLRKGETWRDRALSVAQQPDAAKAETETPAPAPEPRKPQVGDTVYGMTRTSQGHAMIAGRITAAPPPTGFRADSRAGGDWMVYREGDPTREPISTGPTYEAAVQAFHAQRTPEEQVNDRADRYFGKYLNAEIRKLATNEGQAELQANPEQEQFYQALLAVQARERGTAAPAPAAGAQARTPAERKAAFEQRRAETKPADRPAPPTTPSSPRSPRESSKARAAAGAYVARLVHAPKKQYAQRYQDFLQGFIPQEPERPAGLSSEQAADVRLSLDRLLKASAAWRRDNPPGGAPTPATPAPAAASTPAESISREPAPEPAVPDAPAATAAQAQQVVWEILRSLNGRPLDWAALVQQAVKKLPDLDNDSVLAAVDALQTRGLVEESTSSVSGAAHSFRWVGATPKMSPQLKPAPEPTAPAEQSDAEFLRDLEARQAAVERAVLNSFTQTPNSRATTGAVMHDVQATTSYTSLDIKAALIRLVEDGRLAIETFGFTSHYRLPDTPPTPNLQRPTSSQTLPAAGPRPAESGTLTSTADERQRPASGPDRADSGLLGEGPAPVSGGAPPERPRRPTAAGGAAGEPGPAPGPPPRQQPAGGRGGVRGSGRGDELLSPEHAAEQVKPTPAAEAATPTSLQAGPEHVVTDDEEAFLNEPSAARRRDANMAAMRLLVELEQDGRMATAAEQTILARYSGWGDSRFEKIFNEQRYPDKEIEKLNAYDFDELSYDERKDTVKVEAARASRAIEFRLRREIKALVTPEEWNAIRRSRVNAFYTTPDVIRGMWSALERLGIGQAAVLRILEPSAGAGRFLGLQPKHLAARSQRTAVELDTLTGRILKHLYQATDVQIRGFEAAHLRDDSIDVALSNVPFGRVTVFDRVFQRSGREWLTKAVHNYFFAKALDKVRPGGLVAFISSHFTLDARTGERLREYLYERADLVGAIRLPAGAFQDTDVTTDIIFLRKRMPGDPKGDAAWVGTTFVKHPKVDADGSRHDSRTIYGSRGKKNEVIPYGYQLNGYFAAHPEMVLGEHELSGKQYGDAGEYAMRIPGATGEALRAEVARRLPAAISRLPANVFTPYAHEEVLPGKLYAPEIANSLKEGAYIVHQGELMVRRGGELVEPTVTGAGFRQRIIEQLWIRDAARQTLRDQLQGGDPAESMAELNRRYNAYVGKHGPLNSPENRKLLAGDPDGSFLKALETWSPSIQAGLPRVANAQGKITKQSAFGPLKAGKPREALKAAIFSERVIRSPEPIKKTDNAKDALLVSLNEYGRLVPERLAQLTGRPQDDVLRELSEDGLVYDNPTGTWETADLYLSGDVKEKLADAKAAAANDGRYAGNVAALEAVIPADIAPSNIGVRLSSPWIPARVINQFITHELQATIRGSGTEWFEHIEKLAQWQVALKPSSIGAEAQAKYGHERMDAFRLAARLLSGKVIEVRDPDPDDPAGKKTIPNEKMTLEVQEKALLLSEAFGAWLWSDEDRAVELSAIYNERHNRYRVWESDGSHLRLAGSNDNRAAGGVRLRRHQLDVTWRVIQTPATLMAHEVGFGKSYSMIAAGMELRRVGLSRKNVFVILKSMVEQFSRDFTRLYPNASVLVPEVGDFTDANRAVMMARIATGDWDGVILTPEQLVRVPVSDQAEAAFIRQELMEYEDAQADLEAGSPGDKALQAAIKRLEDRLAVKLDAIKARQGTQPMVWEDLGVDALFVDEADQYKNLGFPTQKERVKGMNPGSDSQRSKDLYMKTRLLHQSGKRIVFATGTPISNTIAEMWTMLRYLAPAEMARRGLDRFDAWADTYGQIVSEPELTVAGKLKVTARFKKFQNIPELSALFQQVADIRMSADVPEMEAKQPRVIGGDKPGAPIQRAAPGSQAYDRYMQSIVDRIDDLPQVTDKRIDNMLKIAGDARKASLDIRLVDQKQPDDPNSKVNRAVKDIVADWKASKKERGTLQVFLDLGTPRAADDKPARKAADEDEATQGETAELISAEDERQQTSVYHDLREKLVKAGIPRQEIRFIHEAKSGDAKQQLFMDVNEGRVRVIIGSTGKMGAGVNIQERAYAQYHLDAPWRPRDIEQREGRIRRPGNIPYGPTLDDDDNVTDPGLGIRIYRYVTGGVTTASFDAFMWQALEIKAAAIRSIMRRNVTERFVEDNDEQVASMAEMKAAASGNPLVVEMVTLRMQIARQEARAKGVLDQRLARAKGLRELPEKIAKAKKQIAAIAGLLQGYENKPMVQIDKRTFAKGTDEAAEALLGAFTEAYERYKADQTRPEDLRNVGWASKAVAFAKVRGFDIAFRDSHGLASFYLVDPATDVTLWLGDLQSFDVTGRGLVQRAQNALRDDLPKQAVQARGTQQIAERDLVNLQGMATPVFPGEAELDYLRARRAWVERRLAADPTEDVGPPPVRSGETPTEAEIAPKSVAEPAAAEPETAEISTETPQVETAPAPEAMSRDIADEPAASPEPGEPEPEAAPAEAPKPARARKPRAASEPTESELEVAKVDGRQVYRRPTPEAAPEVETTDDLSGWTGDALRAEQNRLMQRLEGDELLAQWVRDLLGKHLAENVAELHRRAMLEREAQQQAENDPAFSPVEAPALESETPAPPSFGTPEAPDDADLVPAPATPGVGASSRGGGAETPPPAPPAPPTLPAPAGVIDVPRRPAPSVAPAPAEPQAPPPPVAAPPIGGDRTPPPAPHSPPSGNLPGPPVHVRGFGYTENDVDPETAALMAAVSPGLTQYTRQDGGPGVSRAAVEQMAQVLGADGEAMQRLATAVLERDTAQDAVESQALRNAGIGAIDDVRRYEQAARVLRASVDEDGKPQAGLAERIEAAESMLDAAKASLKFWAKAGRRRLEGAGRELQQAQFRVSAEAAWRLVQRLNAAASTLADGAKLLQNGTLSPSEIDRLEALDARLRDAEILEEGNRDAEKVAESLGRVGPAPTPAESAPAKQAAGEPEDHALVIGRIKLELKLARREQRGPAVIAALERQLDAALDDLQDAAIARAEEILAKRKDRQPDQFSPEELEDIVARELGKPIVRRRNREAYDELSGNKAAREFVKYHDAFRNAINKAVDAEEKWTRNLTASFDRAFERALAAERRKEVRQEVSDMAEWAILMRRRLLDNTANPEPYLDEFNLALRKMVEHSNAGEIRARAILAKFELDYGLRIHKLIKTVEARNTAAAVKKQATDTKRFERGYVGLLRADLREVVDLARRNPRNPDLPKRVEALREEMMLAGAHGTDEARRIRKQLWSAGLLRLAQKSLDDSQLDTLVDAMAHVRDDTDEHLRQDLGLIIRIARAGTPWQRFIEMRYINMLSSPLTAGLTGINVVHNALMLVGRLFISNPRDAIHDALRHPRSREATFRETPAALAAVGRAFPEAKTRATSILRTGTAPSDLRRPIEMGDLAGNRRELLSELPGPAGLLAQLAHVLTTRQLEAGDAFLGHLVYASVVQQEAMRKARRLIRGSDPHYRGRREQAVTDEILREIWDHPDVVDAAGKIEDYALQRWDRSSKSKAATVLRSFQAARTLGPHPTGNEVLLAVMSHLLLPFFHITIGTTQQGVERTLGAVNIFRYPFAKDPAEQRKLFGIATTGLAIMGTAIALQLAGGLTGDGPPDEEERRRWLLKHPAHSYRLPGTQTWASWENTPWAIPFAVVANVAEEYDKASQRQGKKLGANDAGTVALVGGAGAAKGLVSAIASQSPMRSLGDAYNALVMERGDAAAGAGAYVANQLAGLMPMSGLLAFLARMYDEVERAPKTVPERLANRLPGAFRESVPVKQDPFGDPVKNPQYGPKALLLFQPRDPDGASDPVLKALEQYGASLPVAPRSMSYPGVPDSSVELSAAEQRRFNELAGPVVRQYVEQSLAAPGWAAATPEAKKKRLEQSVEAGRERARLALAREIGPDELRRRVLESRELRKPAA